MEQLFLQQQENMEQLLIFQQIQQRMQLKNSHMNSIVGLQLMVQLQNLIQLLEMYLYLLILKKLKINIHIHSIMQMEMFIYLKKLNTVPRFKHQQRIQHQKKQVKLISLLVGIQRLKVEKRQKNLVQLQEIHHIMLDIKKMLENIQLYSMVQMVLQKQ